MKPKQAQILWNLLHHGRAVGCNSEGEIVEDPTAFQLTAAIFDLPHPSYPPSEAGTVIRTNHEGKRVKEAVAFLRSWADTLEGLLEKEDQCLTP